MAGKAKGAENRAPMKELDDHLVDQMKGIFPISLTDGFAKWEHHRCAPSNGCVMWGGMPCANLTLRHASSFGLMWNSVELCLANSTTRRVYNGVPKSSESIVARHGVVRGRGASSWPTTSTSQAKCISGCSWFSFLFVVFFTFKDAMVLFFALSVRSI